MIVRPNSQGEYPYILEKVDNKLKYSFVLDSNHYYVTFTKLGPDWKTDYIMYNEHNKNGTNEITYGQRTQFIKIFVMVLNHFLKYNKPPILFFNEDEPGEKSIYEDIFDILKFKNYLKKKLTYGGYAVKRIKEKIGEGLKINDLNHLILNIVSIDEYNSKLSKDKNIVAGFYVKDEQPAKDLARFLEKTNLPILDSDCSPAPDENGDYLVFVEFKRDETFFEIFDKIIKEVDQLCDNDWFIKVYKTKNPINYTMANLKSKVNLSNNASK